MVDAVVIGGGPSGLSAATWLARYRRSVCVLDAGAYRNRFTDQAHGYLGFDPCDPLDLLERARGHLANYGTVEIRPIVAQAVEGTADAFVVHVDGETVEARRIVLATGVRDRFPEVQNFFEHYGSSVFHCPACDGYEARGKHVAVFGWSEQVTQFARGLLTWAASVTVVTDGRPFEGDERHRELLAEEGIRLLQDDAIELCGARGALEAVLMRSGESLPCEMAFFSIAHEPQTALAEKLGCRLDDEGYVVVDEEGRTSVDGVYAAGDLVPGLQLLQAAAATGTVAGIGCAKSLQS